MKVTLLTGTGEQVVLVKEIYPPFPKKFVCRHETGEQASYMASELELLAVEPTDTERKLYNACMSAWQALVARLNYTDTTDLAMQVWVERARAIKDELSTAMDEAMTPRS